MIKVSFAVLPEVYAMLQAASSRAGQVLPVFARDAVFTAAKVDISSIEAQPHMSAPHLTRTKRDILLLLQKHANENKGAPHLTTLQIIGALQQSEQSCYMGLRTLTREGLIERGENMPRKGLQGAPCKTYTISEMGSRVLSDDQNRIDRAHAEFQARSVAAYAALGQGPSPIAPARPPVDPARVHSLLRYIAMAQLGRAIDSEADVDAMKATHARLCQAADSDVAAGAHTYDQILEKLQAKIDSLGGQRAISIAFNGA